MPPDPGQQARATAIATELSAVGLALPGTLLQRRARCGKPHCACHADPPALHGPYWQWTRKIAGKTITRHVPDDQVASYRQWISNDRRLRDLIAELEALTLAIADASPRPRRRKPRNSHQQAHDTVDAARLTCGPPCDHHPFPQVKPKREDLTSSV